MGTESQAAMAAFTSAEASAKVVVNLGFERAFFV